MSKLFLLVQLSDPHIGAEWGGGDPVAMLAAAVASVRALEPEPDAVLISGDLADTAAAAEYEQVLKLRTAVALADLLDTPIVDAAPTAPRNDMSNEGARGRVVTRVVASVLGDACEREASTPRRSLAPPSS